MRIEVVTPPISQSELSKVSIFPGRRSVDQWEASIGCARRGVSGPGTRSWEPGGGGREMIRSVLSAIRSRHHRHWSSKRAPVIQYQVSDNIRLWWNCIEKVNIRKETVNGCKTLQWKRVVTGVTRSELILLLLLHIKLTGFNLETEAC